VLKTGVERAVARTRPNAVLDGRPYSRKRGGSRRRALQAFPSGHTADAVAAARALARAYPDLALPIWGRGGGTARSGCRGGLDQR
jgi:hypothetical protein